MFHISLQAQSDFTSTINFTDTSLTSYLSNYTFETKTNDTLYNYSNYNYSSSLYSNGFTSSSCFQQTADNAINIIYKFDHPEITTDSVISTKKYLEYDIKVHINTDTTVMYLYRSYFRVKFDTVAFGGNLIGKITGTLGSDFNSAVYTVGNFVDSVPYFFIFIQSTNCDSPLTRALLNTSEKPLIHIKMEIKDCSATSGLSFKIGQPQWANRFTYKKSGFANSTSIPFNSISFENTLDVPLCNSNLLWISDFNPTVYPGTWYHGTTDNNWKMEIQGVGFGYPRGNTNVWFKNANNGGQTYVPLDSSDYLLWGDSLIRIKMPSIITSSSYSGSTPGSGIFYIKRDNDSIMSSREVDMPYAIKNAVFPSDSIKKVRIDIRKVNPTDSVNIKFYIGPSISNHSNPKLRTIIDKAIKEWSCLTRIYYSFAGNTTYDVASSDGVSVIRLSPYIDNVTVGVTKIDPLSVGICRDVDNYKHVFPTEIDITLLANPDTLHAGTWFFDTLGVPMPPGKCDFNEVILHELGHAYLLTHSIKVNTPPNNDQLLMFYTSVFNSTDTILASRRRVIGGIETNAGIDVSLVSKSIPINHSTCNSHGANSDTLALTPSNSCIGIYPGEVNKLSNNNSIKIYPNPSSNFVIVQIEGERLLPAKFTLVDISGSILIKMDLTNVVNRIDLGTIANGLYIYQLSLLNATSTNGKIIITH